MTSKPANAWRGNRKRFRFGGLIRLALVNLASGIRMKLAQHNLTQALNQFRQGLGAPQPLEQAVLRQTVAVLKTRTPHPAKPLELELLGAQRLAGVRRLQSHQANAPEQRSALDATLNAAEQFLHDAPDYPQSIHALTQLLDRTDTAIVRPRLLKTADFEDLSKQVPRANTCRF